MDGNAVTAASKTSMLQCLVHEMKAKRMSSKYYQITSLKVAKAHTNSNNK